MDTVTHYREPLKDILTEYERLSNLNQSEGVEASCLFDETHDHYMLIEYAWLKSRTNGSRSKKTPFSAKLLSAYSSLTTGIPLC